MTKVRKNTKKGENKIQGGIHSISNISFLLTHFMIVLHGN